MCSAAKCYVHAHRGRAVWLGVAVRLEGFLPQVFLSAFDVSGLRNANRGDYAIITTRIGCTHLQQRPSGRALARALGLV
jgi:hypothetical protein